MIYVGYILRKQSVLVQVQRWIFLFGDVLLRKQSEA